MGKNIFKIKISPNIIFQEVAGETVLLDLSGEKYYGLDETGTFIWKLLQKIELKDKIIESLLVEFSAPREEIDRDLSKLLNDFEKSGIVSLTYSDGNE
jgi:Coenzyme PQQ synthesis protein D (PqqD)